MSTLVVFGAAAFILVLVVAPPSIMYVAALVLMGVGIATGYRR